MQDTIENTASPFENLPAEMLFLILMQTGDPQYFGRFVQLSKLMRRKALEFNTSLFWKLHYKSAFQSIIEHKNISIDYKQLYKSECEERKKACEILKIPPRVRKLFNWIRTGDLNSIQSQVYNIDGWEQNDFYYFINEEFVDAITLASFYNRKEILAYFYSTLVERLPNNLGKRFILAAACGLTDKVKQELNAHKADIDINQALDDGSTALHLACKNGHHEIVKILLAQENINVIYCYSGENYSDKNATRFLSKHNFIGATSSNDTALISAVKGGHIKIVETLLQNKNIGIDFKNFDGEAALHLAVVLGNIEIIRLLLAAEGGDVNIQTLSGNTPLHVAASSANANVVNVLLEAGANPNMANESGFLPIHCAAKQGCLEVFNQLLEKCTNIHIKTNEKYTLLHLAAKNGHVEIVKILLAAGLAINEKNADGSTPLHLATLQNKLDVVKLLIGESANIDIVNDGGKTSLHIAVRMGHAEIAEILLVNGAKVDIKNNNEETPLHRAAEFGHANIVKILLKARPEIDVKENRYGYTPLHKAVRFCNIEVAQILLEAGANVDSTTNEGNASLHVAVIERCPLLNPSIPPDIAENDSKIKLIEILLKNGATRETKNNDGDTPLHPAVRNFDTKVVEILLAEGCKVDTTNNNGDTPLHTLVKALGNIVPRLIMEGKFKFEGFSYQNLTPQGDLMNLVEILLKAGATIYQKNNRGETPICLAVKNQHSVMIKILVAASVKFDSKDNNGNTLLHFAAEYGYGQIVKSCVEAGFKIDTKNKDGKTPLTIAETNFNFSIADYLLEVGSSLNQTIGNFSHPIQNHPQNNNLLNSLEPVTFDSKIEIETADQGHNNKRKRDQEEDDKSDDDEQSNSFRFC